MNIPLYNLESITKVVKIHAADNQSKILVVYGAIAEAKESQEFLEKILSAVSIQASEVTHIVQLTEENASLSEWTGWATCEVAIFFGISPASLGIHYELKPYQAKLISGRKLLSCDGLEQIRQTEGLKKSLWTALKSIFPTNA